MKSKIHPLVLLSAVPALVGLVLVLQAAFSSEQKRSEDLVQAYAERIARGVSAFFIDGSAVASAAATLTSVQEFNLREASTDLIGFMRANSHIRRISLVDADGYIYDNYITGAVGNRWHGGRRTANNNDPNSQAANVSDRDYFRILVKENNVGRFSVMTNEVLAPYLLDGKAFITSAPIIKDGRSIGVVNVVQTVEDLAQLYKEITMDFLDTFGKEARLFLVSYGGDIISRLEYDETLDAYRDELFGVTEIVPVTVLDDDVLYAIDEAVRHEGRVMTCKIAGDAHLVAGTKMQDTPFAICLAVSKSQMLLAFRLVAIIGIAVFVIAGLSVAIVVIVMSKRMMVRPEKKKKPRRPKPKKRGGNRIQQDGEIYKDFIPPNMPFDEE